jgi:DNA-binding MarR family transcriptional regulator
VLDAQLERDADLNFFEYTVMAMLSEQPTRTLGMSQLAAVTSASLSRLSNVVKRLERRGYLRRQTDPSDGRCTQAVLSDAGMAKVVETAPGHVAAARHFVIDAVTPAQLRQLRAAARPGQGSPGKLTPSCRRISSMTWRVTTDSPSGRTGDSSRPSAMQRAASAASKWRASWATRGSPKVSRWAPSAEASSRSPGR